MTAGWLVSEWSERALTDDHEEERKRIFKVTGGGEEVGKRKNERMKNSAKRDEKGEGRNCCGIVVDADDQLDEVSNSSVPSVEFLLEKKDVDCVRDDYSRGRPMSLFQLIHSVSFFIFFLFPFRRTIFLSWEVCCRWWGSNCYEMRYPSSSA